MTQKIPEGYRTVTPALTVKQGREAIEFYKRAFGAQELWCMNAPDGRILHAEIQVGDSRIMLSDEMPDMGCLSPASVGGPTGSLYLYVPDVDAVFARAVEAGARVLMPVTDMFWGDRFGQVEDPSGHRWGLATHVEDPSREEIERRHRELVASTAKK